MSSTSGVAENFGSHIVSSTSSLKGLFRSPSSETIMHDEDVRLGVELLQVHKDIFRILRTYINK